MSEISGCVSLHFGWPSLSGCIKNDFKHETLRDQPRENMSQVSTVTPGKTC